MLLSPAVVMVPKLNCTPAPFVNGAPVTVGAARPEPLKAAPPVPTCPAFNAGSGLVGCSGKSWTLPGTYARPAGIASTTEKFGVTPSGRETVTRYVTISPGATSCRPVLKLSGVLDSLVAKMELETTGAATLVMTVEEAAP